MRLFYLEYKDNEKLQTLSREIAWSHNIAIWIIICKEKNRTTVEYALKDSQKPIGISTYKLLEQLPRELEDFLPTSEEIARRLEIFENKESKENDEK